MQPWVQRWTRERRHRVFGREIFELRNRVVSRPPPGSLERQPLFSQAATAQLSQYLTQYSADKGIYMKINHVNRNHVHALDDLPTDLTVEKMMQLFKGSSSHWINESDLVPGKFAWGRGYGVFSVSHSRVGEVAKYIAVRRITTRNGRSRRS